VPPLVDTWANEIDGDWLETGDTVTVGVGPVGSVCAVAAAGLDPLVTVTTQEATATPPAASMRPTTPAKSHNRKRDMGGAAYLEKVTETGIWNVAPWHPVCDAVLMAAAAARSMRWEPDVTAMDGLEGKVVETPVVVQVPIPPPAVTLPFCVMPVIVSVYEFGLLTRSTTSLDPPGRSDVAGASPPVRACMVGVPSVPVTADADPDPKARQ
jgi:hypothetical protein